jgi:hypothetical protein
MATFTKVKLSGAGTTNGPIQTFVSPNYGTPVTIHTTGTSSSVLDEIWIYAWSKYNSDIYLDFEIDGITQFSSNFSVSQLGINTPQLIIPGLILSGNGTTGTSIKVVDQMMNGSIYVMGYVNRIS